jgi:hypothetical protein
MTTNASLDPSPSTSEPEPFDELVLAPYSVQEPEPTELEVVAHAVAPAPSYAHLISWRGGDKYATGNLVIRSHSAVCVHVIVAGHPELSGQIDTDDSWELTRELASAFGWRLVK